MKRFSTFLSYFRRNFNTSLSRRAECPTGGIIGLNLPFDINNEKKFTVLYTIFLTTGLGLVPFVVHFQLRKQNQASDDEDK